MNRTFDRGLALGIGLVVALLLLNAGLANRNTRHLNEDARWVAHSHEVIDALNGILSLAMDAETGQRGFLITGEDRYLAPYDAAIAAQDGQFQRLERLTADNPQQQARIPAVRQRLDARLAVLAEGIALRKRGVDFQVVQDFIRAGRGKAHMDVVRNLMAEMRRAEDDVMQDRARQTIHAYRVAQITGLITGGLGLGAVVAFAFLVQRNLQSRAEAAAALHEQKEWLQITLTSIGDAVIATDAAGRVSLLNRMAESLTGWTQDEARGQPLEVVFHIVNEETRQPVDNPAQRALREGVIVGLANHTILISKLGPEWAIDDSAAPIRGADQQLVGAVLVFRDVSLERRAQRTLRQSEARKTAILETSLDCIITMDQRGQILEFNPAAEQTFGHRRDDVLGRDLAELLIPPALRESHHRGLAHYLETGEGPVLNRRLELTAVRADGSEFPVEVSIKAISQDGPPIFTGYLRDITDRKRTEERIAQLLQREQTRSQRLSLVAAASSTINTATTQASVMGIVAEEAKRILDAPHAQVVLEAECPSAPDGSLSAPLIGRGGRPLGHIRLADRPGGFDNDDRAILAQLAHMAAVAFDNARLYEELRDGDRRKDEFLATLAHELRNPLAPIGNALELMRLSADDPETAEQSRAIIQRQTDQLVRLVDDLLDISRISRGKIELRRERVELADVAQAAIETSRPLIDARRHRFTVSLPKEPIYVYGDRTRLTQVLLNLLNNAAKYTDEGGQIDFLTEKHDHHVVLKVRDTGIGIPAEVLPRVFEMFMQVEPSLERAQGGLGIGLSLVKRLVEKHGGQVSVHSAGPGQGSEFVVQLPLCEDEPATDAPAVAPASSESAGALPAAPAGKRRVLVVDDNRDAADTLALMLRMLGHEVEIAHDGLQAVEAASEFRPDLAVLDIGLPQLNGYEAAQRIRALPHGRQIVLVALTGWGQDEDRRRSREAGFDQHLVKPIDPARLKKLLAELPAQQRD